MASSGNWSLAGWGVVWEGKIGAGEEASEWRQKCIIISQLLLLIISKLSHSGYNKDSDRGRAGR